MLSIDENLDEILCETTLIRSNVGVSGSFSSSTSSTSDTMDVVLMIDEEGERESATGRRFVLFREVDEGGTLEIETIELTSIPLGMS